MANSTTTTQFIMDSYRATTAEDKIKFVKEHIVTNYVPVLTKLTDCDRIIEATSYSQISKRIEEISQKDNVIGEDKSENAEALKRKLFIQSPLTYIFFVLNIVDRYTDIDIDYKKVAEEYDTLNQLGYVSLICGNIPPEEYAEYNNFLKMKQDDLLQNEYYIGSYVSNKIDVLGNALEPAIDAIVNVLESEEAKSKLKSFDIKKLAEKFLKK